MSLKPKPETTELQLQLAGMSELGHSRAADLACYEAVLDDDGSER
jgi:hypothetical protein